MYRVYNFGWCRGEGVEGGEKSRAVRGSLVLVEDKNT